MGNELKAMIDSWRNSGRQIAVTDIPKNLTLRFGCPEPIPYMSNIMGTNITLMIRYFGTAQIEIKDPFLVQKYGGIEKLQNDMSKELSIVAGELVKEYNQEKLPFSRLSSRITSMSNIMMMHVKDPWLNNYGVQANTINISGFVLTEESQKQCEKIRKAQSEKELMPQEVQTQTPPEKPSEWKCAFCGTQNTGKFCTNCGANQEQ